MKLKALLLLTMVSAMNASTQSPVADTSDWVVSNIISDNLLDFSKTIGYGTDYNLWITERKVKTVVKVDIIGIQGQKKNVQLKRLTDNFVVSSYYLSNGLYSINIYGTQNETITTKKLIASKDPSTAYQYV